MVRKPIVSGQFYPNDKTALEKQIKSFLDNLKINEITKLKNKRIYGAIVPHAGYVFSGKTAAYSYKSIEEKQKEKPAIDLFVIFGTNHSAYENIIVNLEDFGTPLGIVKTSKISEKIYNELKKSKESSVGNLEQEHSIEVQLPFLQYLYKKDKKSFEIISILTRVDNAKQAKSIADVVYQHINKYYKGKNIFVLASSDFTHYGYSYGFVPFTSNVLENIKKLDFSAINEIEKLNTGIFLEKARKTTICGQDAIACSIELCKLLGAKSAKLLDYITSADVTRDTRNVVAYASLVYV